jgi:hypothetical protein
MSASGRRSLRCVRRYKLTSFASAVPERRALAICGGGMQLLGRFYQAAYEHLQVESRPRCCSVVLYKTLRRR